MPTPHPGSDCLFAKGRRLLVTWVTAMKTDGIGRAVVNWCHSLQQQCQLILSRAVSTCVQRSYEITTWRQPFSRRSYQQDGCRNYVIMPATVCCTQHVCSDGIGKLVCNNRKSILSESILTILSCIEIHWDLAGTRKKSVLTENPL